MKCPICQKTIGSRNVTHHLEHEHDVLDHCSCNADGTITSFSCKICGTRSPDYDDYCYEEDAFWVRHFSDPVHAISVYAHVY